MSAHNAMGTLFGLGMCLGFIIGVAIGVAVWGVLHDAFYKKGYDEARRQP